MDRKTSPRLGQAASSVEVTAVPMIEDTKTDVSAVVDSRSIEGLPINGRRVEQFALLTPDVHQDGTFGLLSFRGVAGQNSFLVDANHTTHQFYTQNTGPPRI